jgi:hypothetical protein
MTYRVEFVIPHTNLLLREEAYLRTKRDVDGLKMFCEEAGWTFLSHRRVSPKGLEEMLREKTNALRLAVRR